MTIWAVQSLQHPASWRAPSRQVTAAAATLAVLLCGLFVYDQRNVYRERTGRAVIETENLRKVLVEHAAQAFAAIDKTLSAVVWIEDEARTGPLDKATIHRLLRAAQGASVALKGVGWVDVRGDRIGSSIFVDPPPLNVGSQEQFTAHRDADGVGLFIADPVRSRLTDETVLLVSKRLTDPDGNFGGIVSGLVDIEYFSAFYRTLDLGPGGAIALLRHDGMVIAQEPAVPGAGRGRDASPVTGEIVLRTDAEIASVPLSFFGDSRGVVSRGVVPGLPLVTVVSVSREAVLAGFWARAGRDAGRLGLALIALAIGTALLVVQLRRREASEVKFRGLLDSAPDATIICGGDGRIVLVNQAAERLFGYSGTDLLGKSIEELLPEAYREKHAAYRAGYADQPTPRGMGAGLELRARLRDGTEVPVEVGLSPLRTSEGLLVSAAVRDITERKKHEAELAAAREQAEDASRAKSDFLARMSHELRTPLNAIIGFGQMLDLDRPGTLSPEQKDYARFIVDGGQHLLELVNEVLDLGAIEAGTLKLSLERIVAGDTLARVRDTLLPLANQAGVLLACDLGTQVPDIRADNLRLRQVLLNLVSNAIKYNRPGGSVTLTAMAVPGSRVRIVVADTGMGIAPERHQDLFMPFGRAATAYTAVGGTGVGLALAKRFVEAMGGTIGFDSQVGHGSTFWLELPVETAAAAPAAKATASHVLLDHRGTGGYSLLYVEDNPANLKLMEHLLSTLPDVAMLSAPSPQLGLDLARIHAPDVIVLDLNLPGMSGFDVLARLKAMPETMNIPVLALTASAMPNDVKRGEAAGFFRFLTKPIDVKIFFAAIDAALAHGRARPRTVNGN